MFQKDQSQQKGKKTELSKKLEKMGKLKIFIKNSKCDESIQKARKKLLALDSSIEKECSEKNSKLVEDYVSSLTENGHFSQTGMWKLRKKLHPSR